ncbi:FDS protein [Mycena capillaripes]|nr:FDS protein [Mycena capillaripes]
MANDSGSGAYLDIATWAPCTDYEWFYLGQAVSSSYEEIPIVWIISGIHDSLAPVSRWEKVWDNSGSRSARDLALWRGVSDDPNYVVMGGILSDNAGHTPPTAQQTDGIMAIRRDLVIEDTTEQVWTDAGTGATQDGSVWKTIGNAGDFRNLMIPVHGHATPPQNESYSVKAR